MRSFIAGSRPSSRPHAPPQIGACAACHLTHDPQWIQVGASRGHRIHVNEQKIPCLTCHGRAVHHFEPAAASCKECHGEHAVRAAGMQQIHCFACHDFLSVEPRLLPTRRDCLRCHRSEGVHPARFPEEAPMRFACAACHKPHAPPEAEIVSCGECHKGFAKAGLHKTAAHQDCRACHKAHGWKSEQADCLPCHKHASTHSGHLTCAVCHGWSGAPPPSGPNGGN